jgi:hypothetical protein
LFSNEHSVWPADGACNNPAFHTLKLQRKHGGVEACPGVERCRYSLLYKPIGQVPVEFQKADDWEYRVADIPQSSNIVN